MQAKPAQVLIDVQSLVLSPAGVGHYTHNLVSALARLDDADFAFSSVCFDFMRRFDPAQLPAEGWGSRRVRFPGRVANKLWSFVPFPPFNWFSGRADLFHFPNFVLPPLSRGKSVITVHDAAFVRLPDTIEPKNLAFLRRTMPGSLKRADAVIVPSAFTRDELVECFGLEPEKITVTHEGVDARFFNAVEPDEVDALRKKRGLPKRFILALGTIEPRKNLCTLFDAFRRLCDDGRDGIDLVVAGGRGWLDDDIFAHVARIGLGDRIHFIGYVPDSDLPALYRAAEIFAFVSYYEGFGLPLIEAMASGLPAVISDAPALVEVAGGAALFAPACEPDAIADELRALLDDKKLKNDIIEAGLKRAATFTWEKTARQTARLYRRVLA